MQLDMYMNASRDQLNGWNVCVRVHACVSALCPITFEGKDP